MADVREAVNAFIDAFNAHDERRMREGYAESVVFEAPGGVRVEGPDAATQFAMSFIRAFPDVRLTVRNQFESEGWVAFEAEFVGTHQDTLEGPGGSIPPDEPARDGPGRRDPADRGRQGDRRAALLRPAGLPDSARRDRAAAGGVGAEVVLSLEEGVRRGRSRSRPLLIPPWQRDRQQRDTEREPGIVGVEAPDDFYGEQRRHAGAVCASRRTLPLVSGRRATSNSTQVNVCVRAGNPLLRLRELLLTSGSCGL